MRILNLTKYRRICLQQMLNDLFYEFDRIKLKRNGFVIFQRNKFKFWDREKIHASELIVKEIPERIERFNRRFQSRNYPYYTPTILKNTLEIINGEMNTDIIEYLWKEFTKVKFPVNKIKPSNAIIAGEVSLLSAFNKHCESLILSPMINIGDILSHIKKEFNNSKQKITKINLKRILDWDYFPVKQLLAA